MTARRYAEQTSVSVSKTRGEIDDLLLRWGCGQIAWGNDFAGGRFMLQFVWSHGGQDYLARFAVQLPTDAELQKMAVHPQRRSRGPQPAKLEKLRQARGRVEHRQLLLWLKAALNAVEAGIISAEAIFLPWLVTRSGETVAEVALPRLPAILSSEDPTRLLGAGSVR